MRRTPGVSVAGERSEGDLQAEPRAGRCTKLRTPQKRISVLNTRFQPCPSCSPVPREVFAGCMGETDVRRVTTPAMIEEILQLLGIKPLDEPFLIGRLKVCIEDASAHGDVTDTRAAARFASPRAEAGGTWWIRDAKRYDPSTAGCLGATTSVARTGGSSRSAPRGVRGGTLR